jgi:hypothetical protein
MKASDATPSGESGARLLVPCQPTIASDRARMIAVAAAFRARHPDGCIASLVPEPEVLRQADFEVVSMDELLPYGSFLDVWRRAYRVVDRFFAAAGPDLAAIARPFYHAAADLALRALMTEAALKTVNGPLLLFAPAAGTAVWRELPVGLVGRTWSWKSFSIGGVHTAAVIRALRRLLGTLPRARPAADAAVALSPTASAGKMRPAVLIAVDDGVSGVNLPSARAIAQELGARGRAIVVLTGHPQIANEFAAMGADALYWGVPSLKALRPARMGRLRRSHSELLCLRRNRELKWEERAFAGLLVERLLPFAVSGATIEWLLEDYCRRVGAIGAGLAINEGTPTAVAALAWLQARDIPDIGYWPAMLGDRPDCEFFPARRHLVYGTQLRDKMVALGVGADAIEAVGSVNFDHSLFRDRVRDKAMVCTDLLRGRPAYNKLVVVATEALPRPLEEIGPALEALAPMADVEIVLKLHPADSAAFYRSWLAKNGLSERVLLVEACDLDALLNSADLLVCILSNVIVRAALLGTPTLVCDFGDKRRPLDFVAEGLATGCFLPEQVGPTLSAMLEDGPVREAAIAKLKSTAERFNHGADGGSAERVAERLEALLRN